MMTSVERDVGASVQSVFDRYRHRVQHFQPSQNHQLTGSERIFDQLIFDHIDDVTVADLLEHRSRYTGWNSEGFGNASGSCRLIFTADCRWVAVNLARPSDGEILGAVLGVEIPDVVDLHRDVRLTRDDRRADRWSSIESAISQWTTDDLMAATADLGLPLSCVGESQWSGPLDALPVHQHLIAKIGQVVMDAKQSFQTLTGGESTGVDSLMRRRVVDLSSLWAGPLCSRLLIPAGCSVTTVESSTRPDSTRDLHPHFYADLHDRKEHVVLDLSIESGRQQLRDLLFASDVVITGSRRRAFDHLGIDVDEILSNSLVSVWVSITGYGYRGSQTMRVGFGDDCAAAGGLLTWHSVGNRRQPTFAGDALADPITGLVAATAVLDYLSMAKNSHTQGCHLDVRLAEVANWVSRGGRVAINP